MLLLDGLFVEDGDEVRWVKVPAPTTEEVQQLVAHLARTVERWLDTQGYGGGDACDEDEDDDANGVLLAASVAGRTALGARAGAKVRRLQRAHTRPFRLPSLCAEAQGYNLHAAVVIGCRNRDGLERLCRYVLRPPLARKRLRQRGDGLLVLTLRKPYANGTTDFIFSEVELAQRLAALVPPARKNGVSYHGVLAPRHRFRNRVIPEPPAQQDGRARLTKKPKGTSRWRAWADLPYGPSLRSGFRPFRFAPALAGVRGRRPGLRLRRAAGPARRGPPTRDAGRPREPAALRQPHGPSSADGQLTYAEPRSHTLGRHAVVRPARIPRIRARRRERSNLRFRKAGLAACLGAAGAQASFRSPDRRKVG